LVRRDGIEVTHNGSQSHAVGHVIRNQHARPLN
jgi:hypothetical protein